VFAGCFLEKLPPVYSKKNICWDSDLNYQIKRHFQVLASSLFIIFYFIIL